MAEDDPHVNRVQSVPTRLECGETWAGNERTSSLIELPGLVAWVSSIPSGPGEAGGDVHYATVCPSCIVSRIALADVSGHGQAVVSLGEKLRELMQHYLRELEQVGLMRDLNQAVRDGLDDVHYATMVAVGWHGRRGLLVLTNAGHPPPFWYRPARNEWSWLETQRARASGGRPAGVPLGLLPDINYDRMVVKPHAGDLMVLYSRRRLRSHQSGGRGTRSRWIDEHRSRVGLGLGGGIRDWAHVKPWDAFREGTEAGDDTTVIVLQTTA